MFGCQLVKLRLNLLTSAPLLAAPKMNKPFKLQVDASKVGAGAVLLQDGDDSVERPVCYFSRKIQFISVELFNDRERSTRINLGFANF